MAANRKDLPFQSWNVVGLSSPLLLVPWALRNLFMLHLCHTYKITTCSLCFRYDSLLIVIEKRFYFSMVFYRVAYTRATLSKIEIGS